MRLNTYIIGLAVILTFACGGLGWWGYEMKSQLDEASAQIVSLDDERRELADQIVALDGDLAERVDRSTALASELASARERATRLENEKREIEQAQEKLESDMQRALSEQEVTISRLKGKLTVNILDRILFDSGRAELKPEGRELLQKVAEVLKTVPDRQVLIVGHTDNVPVTASRHLFASNWELSAARATAAVRFLSESGAVDSRNLGALAYGEYHPIAENSTPAGRAQNRRIEVVILDSGVLMTGQ